MLARKEPIIQLFLYSPLGSSSLSFSRLPLRIFSIGNKDIFIEISISEKILAIYLLPQHVALGHVLEVLNQNLLQVMRR